MPFNSSLQSNPIDSRCFDAATANVISISGGKDSLAQWLLAIENGVSNVMPVFADTGHEHPLTMEYLDYLETNLGPVKRVRADFTERLAAKRQYVQEHWPDKLTKVTPGRWASIRKTKTEGPDRPPADPFAFHQQVGDYVWISARPALSDAEACAVVDRALSVLHPTGNPFADLCLWKGRFPSTRARFCSFELKHEPVRVQHVEPLLNQFDEVISWQGVRAQESKARENLDEWVEDADSTAGLHVYRPIHKWLHEDVFAIARRHGIKPNPLYTMGCDRVGCMPCIHIKKSELREMFERWPEVVQYMNDMERLVANASKRGNSTFFVSTLDPRRAERDSRLVTLESHGFSTYEGWAMTTRGGNNYDLLASMNDKGSCNSPYSGVCE